MKMSLSVEQFLRAATDAQPHESVWRILLHQKALITQSQVLLNHIVARPHGSLPSVPSSTASFVTQQDELWCIVALIASSLTPTRSLEPQEEPADDVPQENWQFMQLLVASRVPFRLFLEYFTSLFDRLLVDPEAANVATQWKETFTMATVLFEKYQHFWQRLGHPTHNKQPFFDVGWLVFLIAKHKLAARGLGQQYFLLLGVLQLVLSSQLRSNHVLPATDSSLEVQVAATLRSLGSSSAKAQELLQSLCSQPKVESGQVTMAIRQVEQCLQELHAAQILTAPQDKATTTTDLLSQEANVRCLANYYAQQHLTSPGSLDERFYLDTEAYDALISETNPSARASSSHSPPKTPFRPRTVGASSPFPMHAWQSNGASPSATNLSRVLGTPNRSLAAAAASQSPFTTAQTPVTAAVETTTWVRETLRDGDGSASFLTPELASFFAECTTDPTDRIAQLLKTCCEKLVASRRHLTGPFKIGSLAAAMDENAVISEVDESLVKTQQLARSLFYRVLQSLLVAERERLQSSNFSTLLHNETFLKSLFCCSLELVLKAHSLLSFTCPRLSDILEMNAFDLGKIIESFVKHVPKLPIALKRHMRDLEQSILEQWAWQSTSALYTIAPSRQNALHLFFRKVLSLAASRIYRLGTLLGLEALYLNQIWTAVKECVSAQHALLQDRHLDHVILCSVYGVCKVNHVTPEVTFKRILDCYRQLYGAPTTTHGRSMMPKDLIRSIRLDQPGQCGDIIKFYNRCFIPTMKVFLLQFQLHETQVVAADQAAQRMEHMSSTTTSMTTSDSEIVAEAAVSATEKFLQSTSGATTAVESVPTPPVSLFRSTAPTTTAVPLFTTAEIEALPVSVQHTSPKRVLSSNLYMSPLQQARLHQRTHLTPRSHALYAFGESPSRDLALINRAVNTEHRPLVVTLPTAPLAPKTPVHAAKRRKL